MHAPPGWLKGKCGDKVGLFPENYVEKITEEEAKTIDTTVRSPSPEEAKAPEVSVKSLVASISQQLSGGSVGVGSGGGSIGGSAVSHSTEQETTTSAKTTQSAVTTTTSDANVCELQNYRCSTLSLSSVLLLIIFIINHSNRPSSTIL